MDEEPIKPEKKWYQSKTIWTGIIGVVTAAGAGMTGTMSPAEAIQTGLGSLAAIFIRQGMLG